jgi:hypothetical protein
MAHAQKLRSRNEPKLTKKETLLNQYPEASWVIPRGAPHKKETLLNLWGARKKETLLNQRPIEMAERQHCSINIPKQAG